MTDIAQLGFDVDTSGPSALAGSLDKVAASAKGVDASLNQLGTAAATAATKVKAGASATEDYAARLQKMEAMVAKLEKANATLRTGFESQKATIADMSKSMAALQKTLDDTVAAHDKAKKKTKEHADQIGLARHEMVNLSRQMQDVGVSLVSGQSPFLILAQQGTQVYDIFSSSRGTFAGFLTQLRAMGGVTLGAAAGVAAVGAAIYAAASYTRGAAVEYSNLARTTGMTADSMTRLQSVASTKGIGSQEFNENAQKFAQYVFQAQANMGPLAELMQFYGLRVRDAEDAWGKLATIIRNTPDDLRKLAILQSVGIPPTIEWVKLLEQGGQKLEVAKGKMVGLSAATDDALAKRAKEFDELWNTTITHMMNYAKNGAYSVYQGFDFGIDLIRRFYGQEFPDALQKLGVRIGALNAPLEGSISKMSAALRDPYAGGTPETARKPISAVTPAEARQAIELDLQRLSALGQLLTVEQQVQQVELNLKMQRMTPGSKITDDDVARVMAYTRAMALGVIAIRQQSEAARVEGETVGMGIAQATAYRAVQDKIIENRLKGIELTKSEIAELQKWANEYGENSLRAAEKRMAADAKFELAQMGRSDIEQKVAERMRSLYGDEYPRMMDSAIASQIRFNEQLKKTRELGSQALTGFLSDLRAGKGPMDALISQATKLGDKFVEAGAKQIIGQFGAGGGFGSFDLSTFTKGVQKGVSGGLADFAKGGASAGAGAGGGGGAGIGMGLAGIGVLASAYSTGYGSSNKLQGALTGGLTGAMGGFAIAGPVGAAIGGVVGALAGLFGAMNRANDELKKAQEDWKATAVRFRAFNETLSGRAPGQLGQALDSAEDQMKQFITSAKAAQDTGAITTVQNNFEAYKTRLVSQFKSLFGDTLDAYQQGFGADSPFLKAAQQIQGLSESIKTFVSDTNRAFSTGSGLTGVSGRVGGLGGAFGVGSEWNATPTGGETQAEAARRAGRDYLLALLAGVKPLSDVATKMLSLNGMAAQLQTSLVELGMSAGEAQRAIAEKLNVALGKLKTDFIDGIQAKINDATGKGFLNDISALIKERDTMLADAQRLGVDPTLIGRYFSVQAQKIVDESGLVGSAFAELVKTFPDLSGVVTESTAALQANIDKQKQAMDEAQTFINGVSRSITSFLANLKGGSDSYLSPTDRLGAAQASFNTQVSLARGGDRDALTSITQFASTYLNAAKDYYASGSGYQTIVQTVTSILQDLPAAVSAEQLVTNAITDMKTTLAAAIGLNSPAAIAAALEPQFKVLDTNNDGLLTIAEFQKGLAGVTDDKSLADIFNNLDVNKDGVVSKLELVRASLVGAIDAGNATAIAGALSSYFNSIDANTDNIISLAEFNNAIAGLAKNTSVTTLLTQAQVSALGLSKDATVGGLLTANQLISSGVATDTKLGTLLTDAQLRAAGLSKDQTVSDLRTATGAVETATNKVFSEIDNNGNGLIEKTELVRYYSQSIDSSSANSMAYLNSIKAITDATKTIVDYANTLTGGSGGTNALLDSIKSLQSSSKGTLDLLYTQTAAATVVVPTNIVSGPGPTYFTQTVSNTKLLEALNKIVFNTAALVSNSALIAANTYKPVSSQVNYLVGAFAEGGWVSGPGGGTSDSVNARLSNGEYVVSAAAARALAPFMDTINAGMLPAFVAANDNGALANLLRVLIAEVQGLHAGFAHVARAVGASGEYVAGAMTRSADVQATEIRQASRRPVRKAG